MRAFSKFIYDIIGNVDATKMKSNEESWAASVLPSLVGNSSKWFEVGPKTKVDGVMK